MATIDKITVNGTTYDITDTTSGYMSTVSSPTADDVLTVDANGQATDSGVQISDLATATDLTGKVDKSGDTMSGGLKITSSNIDVTTTPSTNEWGNTISLRDKNDKGISFVQSVQRTNGTLQTYFNTTKTIGTSSYVNGFYLGVDNNGDPVVTFTTDAAPAWLTGLGAQAALTASTGISIDSSNNISVAFANLVSTDIDTIDQFIGYAQSTCQNLPVTMGGLLISRVSTNNSKYGVQLFYPTNTTVSYIRRKNNTSTWGTWGRVDDSYRSGDTFTIASGSNDYVMCTGYCVVSSNANNMRFFMPLSKPITASSITVTQMYVYALVSSGGNSWVINNTNVVSSASQTAGYSLTVRKEENGIYFNLKCPSSVALTNRDVVTVLLYNTSISFS